MATRFGAFASNTEFRSPEKRGVDSLPCRRPGGQGRCGIRALKSSAFGNVHRSCRSLETAAEDSLRRVFRATETDCSNGVLRERAESVHPFVKNPYQRQRPRATAQIWSVAESSSRSPSRATCRRHREFALEFLPIPWCTTMSGSTARWWLRASFAAD